MASGGSEYTSDEIFNFKCSSCLANNRNREAAKYCVECQGYCCQSCADMIHMMPALKGHTLLDNSNYKSSSFHAGLPAVPTERCSSHETKIVDIYCGNHDEVGCTTCMALNHRSCADVQSIPDTVDSKFQTTDVDKIHQKLQDLKIMMEKIMNTRQRLIEDLKKSKTEAVMAIKDFRKEMEIIFEQLEKESIKELEIRFIEKKSKLLEEQKKAETELDGLKQAVNELKKSEGNKAQQFVSMKMSLKGIAKTEDASRSLQTSDVKILVSYSFDPAILRFLQQLKTFGSVRHDSATALRSQRTTVYSAKSIDDLNIRVQNDNKTCCVYGSCLTEDGSLLLSDYSNNKIKRADIVNMSITNYCCVPANPFGI
ncbi:transcription intermediary factor 1-alpha-like [Mercenaria mercenaria]|uniref:transcription intermediary factor 1-alpha-like n=1 Tax=Mercenaria mercenaria TaxID=6596 RepID=UPI00234ED714|nr:transcription intermediary factor 1-alpha-like [Mercenaria mercenaria]